PEPADAADALAVALCHAHHSRARERMTAAMSAGAAQAALRLAGRNPRTPAGSRMRPARIHVSR
ncbi:MAG: crossover junction endodeoxyribonuclease RuvC, partial [Candidatus Binataceae bacterium]